jgi:peptide/nickel transport system substrate-binding protein
MKGLVKFIVLFSFCLVYISSLGYPGEVWSAPKGKIVVAQGGDPSTLDPHMHSETFALIVQRHFYDSLMQRVLKEDKFQELPMLATSWKAINETTWIFNLRKGVKFHNGEEFNAESVKYSIDRVLNPAQKAKWRHAFTSIDHVEIVDPYTVKVITKVPLPMVTLNLAYNMPIVPAKYFKEKGDAYVATHPVGTGPFKFVHWKKDDELVMEANENYWAGSPNFKTLIFKPIPDKSTQVSALIGGDVDVLKNVPFHLLGMVNNSKRAKIVKLPGTMGMFCPLETRKGPLQDKRLRQAINYGVDKEAIIKHVLDGYAKSLGSPLTPVILGYDPNIKPYPYDPAKAKALLKEAGLGEGLITFNSPTGRYDKDKEVAEAIAGQLEKVGIKIDLRVHEWGNYAVKMSAGEAGPMYMLGWIGTGDADGVLFPCFGTDQQFSFWSSKEFDGLLDQARGTLDIEKRKKLYSQACKLMHEEAPALFLYVADITFGVSNRVQTWAPTADESTCLYMYGASVKD